MQHLCTTLEGLPPFRGHAGTCQALVRFFALHRIKPRAPPLVRALSISLSFSLAAVLPRRRTYRVSSGTGGVNTPYTKCAPFTAGTTRVSNPVCSPSFRASVSVAFQRGASPPVFFLISTHFTATPRIPLSPPALKSRSFECNSTVEPWDFTSDLRNHLRTLYAQ